MTPLPRGRPRWRRRLAVVGRWRGLMPTVELLVAATLIGIFAATYQLVTREGAPGRLLGPPLVALLLVANLVPVIAIMVLAARRVARRRARLAQAGGGQLHVRLVAAFSVLAAAPTLLVVIFASLLFQYGVEFWFSDRARTILENADRASFAYVEENKERIGAELEAMVGDTRNALTQATFDDPRFSEFIAQQLAYRGLTEAAIISVGRDRVPRLLVGANLDKRPLERRLPLPLLPTLNRGDYNVSTGAGERVEATIAIDPRTRTYLYISRHVDPLVLAQVSRARSALSDYNSMVDRSRALQLQFNAALLLISLLIVGVAIWIAFAVADRLVRPVGELVGAARRVAAGDLGARVQSAGRRDEVGTLAAAFNRMTRRLQEQTGALVSANAQLDSRRALTEAVLSGVTAGVISVGDDRRVRLMNRSAEAILRQGADAALATPLAEVAPALDALLDGAEREAVVQLAAGGDLRTLAVKLVRSGSGGQGGLVITFDDITEQVADQRRAAWADVARRIAHEIKNPLTPISLAAERLQRRYGREIVSDPGTFERLTSTIVRQVGDIRRMVDEFSSFARMPKPAFAPAPIAEVAAQALFLHEVAHPHVRFVLDAPKSSPAMVCDRRQLGQALTNLVKNAVEAIAARSGGSARRPAWFRCGSSRTVRQSCWTWPTTASACRRSVTG